MPTNALALSRKRILLAAAVVAVLAASVLWWCGGAHADADTTAAAPVSPQKVIKRNFADPEVNHFGKTYYAYATNTGGRNLPVATAPSPGGPWKVHGKDALPRLGAWAKGGKTWAPDVSRRADGKYLLYYTAHSRHPDLQCIGAAVAKSPLGPFKPLGTKALVCPPSDGGAIDASSFVEGKQRYLLYKSDLNSRGLRPKLYLQRTDASGVRFQRSRVTLLRNDLKSEHGIIEAPVMVKHGDWYVLFYSGGVFSKDNYFTGVARSRTLTGPFKRMRPLITTASTDGAVKGPGGADVVPGAHGVDSVFFHGLTGAGRSMFRADLGWAGGRPVVRGSRARYEAENGAFHDCRVRDHAKGASGGKVAARIDHSDSHVDIRFFAPRAGRYFVAVGYATGSRQGATHRLSVDGGAARTVTYPLTGWDNWKRVHLTVNAKAGWNTLRFAHGKGFTELDFVEVR
ncbi:MAG TPA: family 43 glycosylhydrolase [Stackebrandtia sp.]|jgi:hypothetical protein|uniref:family 43 glycosylhydrolase n=1 Tax=Stackebrandtia sp. TaxID=2023065 RepID=UPI002D4B3CCF|nr:family 43 glycosylhydrolase [Stackebrandtia sp.]HZE37954.1 family 43 glycosylhydrolase [Stackebrandtia sp.]